jgi:hypothetical protein
MSHRDHKEPNDFTQKMRNEGKAGFGAGPWSNPAKIGVKAQPAVVPPGNSRTRSGAPPPARPGKHAPCRLGDRILTGLAIMSLGMLIVGAMGAYLSNDSQHVATTTHSEYPAPAGLPESTDARFMELERRLTQVNDVYGERLHSLETEMEQTVEPYNARLTKVESRLESSGDSGAERLRDPGIPLEQFNASRYEARLATLENRLEQAVTPYHAELRDMENRMGQGYANYEARLREMENRLMQIQVPVEQRLQALEQRLIYASARLDYLSSEMESLINNTAVIEASATLQASPPAALPVAAPRDVPVDGAGPQWLAPSTVTVNTEVAATAREADTDGPIAPAANTPTNGTVPSTDSQTPIDTVPDMPETGGSTADTTPVAEADEVIATAPQTVIAQAEATQTQARPVESAREMRGDNPPGQAATGDWVINLASYASESIAARKLADFSRKGVTAEQTVATVNGKTIYRVRVAGFDTRKSAMDRAEKIRQQLGLKDTWITRQ